MNQSKKKIPLNFGPLNINGINDALALELDSGDVTMSISAQNHAQRNHPRDYAHCLPHIASVVNNPLYVRDDYKNPDKVELVSKPAGFPDWLLVAVRISIDINGCYNIVSFYPISDKKVENRKAKGHYKRLITK